MIVFMVLCIMLFTYQTRCSAATDSLLAGGWQFCFTDNDSVPGILQHKEKYHFQNVAIPHVFPLQNKTIVPAIGFGWYACDMDIPAAYHGKDVFLDFEGVCLRCDVFVNGIRAGGSSYAYLPFRIYLTPFCAGKTHLSIMVRVDNRLLPNQIPDVKARGWWLYGGIIRNVHLVVQPKQKIDNAELRTFYRGRDTFDLHVKLIPGQTVWDSVELSVLSTGKRRHENSCTIHRCDTTIRFSGITPWTPENPYRYTFIFVPFFKGKAGDTLVCCRGFCQLTAQDDKLYLNGKPYRLRGISRHDVWADKGPLLTRGDRLKDFADIKSLGVNCIRIAHFPQDRDVYEICDSIGLLVMDEIPAWKTDAGFLGSAQGTAFACGYMKQLISAHGNYSCIALWSIGNQINSFQKSVAGYVEQVCKCVKENDASRLVTFCSYCYMWDKAFSSVDVISINEYFGWELASVSMLAPMLRQIHKDWPHKPVLVSEIGAQSCLGLREANPSLAGVLKSMLTKDLSEDHQALYIQSHLDTIEHCNSFVCGTFIWTYADYKSYLNKAKTASMPFGINACGIVSEDRKPKMSYYILKNYYNKIDK